MNLPLPRPFVSQPVPAEPTTLRAPRRRIVQSWQKPAGRWGDRSFRAAVMLCGAGVIALVLLIVFELVSRSRLSILQFGLRFLVGENWDPVNGDFGALPFIYGTVVSSILALVLAVPLAVGVAIFSTELCPRKLREGLSLLVELLAAIPSVIYGLWAIFVLVPVVRKFVEPWLTRNLGWTGLFEGPKYGIGMLAAGIVLAIMIIPIISSITREVMLAVPQQQREGVLALGATQWEMIRTGILRNARSGILGAIILGLGRALGETMAVTMVIGNRPEISRSLFAPGYTLASVIANEFSEASSNLHLSVLVELGLTLFIVTLIVNACARLLVWSITRGTPERAHA
jgi:phosphate transport system permease protein